MDGTLGSVYKDCKDNLQHCVNRTVTAIKMMDIASHIKSLNQTKILWNNDKDTINNELDCTQILKTCAF